jgi:DNA polymerase-3 subunit epsilon
MNNAEELKALIESLKGSDQYRIIEKYNKPDYYNSDYTNESQGRSQEKLIGVFLDVETTGINYLEDKIIELAMVSFEYTQDGKIYRILNEFQSYQDPGRPIPEHITSLTGISDEMVRDKNISPTEVYEFLQDADLIIAHNVSFDRSFIEAVFPSHSIPQKPWACSMSQVHWQKEGIESSKLEYIAYRQGFFYEKHRAISDCLAGIHILAQKLPKSQKSVLSTILENSAKITFRLHAVNAPYAHKDLLKQRNYKWNKHQLQSAPCWSIELDKNSIKDEIDFLRSQVYLHHVNLPIDIIDSCTRFSSLNSFSVDHVKYKQELEWVRGL